MQNWRESLFIHAYQQQGLLIDEQEVNDFDPLEGLANVTVRYQDHST